MAARSTAPEKRPGFFSQIRTLYTFTQKAYRWLPWVLAAILLVGVGRGPAGRVPAPPGRDLERHPVGRHRPHARRPGVADDDDPAVDERDVQADRRDAGGRRPRPVDVARPQLAVQRDAGRREPEDPGGGLPRRRPRRRRHRRRGRPRAADAARQRRALEGAARRDGRAGHGVSTSATARTRCRSPSSSSTIKALPKKIDRATMAAVIKRLGLGVAVARVAADPEGDRPDEGTRAAPALTRRRSLRRGRRTVPAALSCRPRWSASQMTAGITTISSAVRTMRAPQAHPRRRRARTSRSPRMRCPGLPCSVGMNTIWIEREDREDRERVPAEEPRDQVRGAVVDEQRADAAAEPRDRAGAGRGTTRDARRDSSARS